MKTDKWTPTAIVLIVLCCGLSACSNDNFVEEVVVPCSREDSNPEITRWATPVYPPEAIVLGLEGTVIVAVLVGIGGKPENAEVIQSAHILLNEAAIEAAMECQFVPGLTDCTVTSGSIALPFNFRLR